MWNQKELRLVGLHRKYKCIYWRKYMRYYWRYANLTSAIYANICGHFCNASNTTYICPYMCGISYKPCNTAYICANTYTARCIIFFFACCINFCLLTAHFFLCVQYHFFLLNFISFLRLLVFLRSLHNCIISLAA